MREMILWDKLASTYLKEVGRDIGRIPISIICDRDPRFASNFWRSLQNALGTNLNMSTAYHPQTDAKPRGSIQTRGYAACLCNYLERVGLTCAISRVSYNNRYHAASSRHHLKHFMVESVRSTCLLDWKLRRSIVGPRTNSVTTEKIIQIKQRMQAARDRQKSYADLKRKPMEFQVGDKVMLKVLPWKGVVRFGKRGKLNPRYVRPFKVLEKVREVAYKLELPEGEKY
ncbi:putative reverse transcriptase domain-containing protein [Tanacetum coccineum]